MAMPANWAGLKGVGGGKCTEEEMLGISVRTSSTTTRDRNLQFRGAVSTGGSPLGSFCFFSSIYVQFGKTSPVKSGESSEKSSGENRVKSCHVCGCHGFFGPDSEGNSKTTPQTNPSGKLVATDLLNKNLAVDEAPS